MPTTTGPLSDDRGPTLPWLAVGATTVLMVIAIGLRLARPVSRDAVVSRPTHERIDLNAADAPTLALLPGIGQGLALRIVEHRATHGPFASVQSLQAVHGVGFKTVRRLAPLVTCEARADPGDASPP